MKYAFLCLGITIGCGGALAPEIDAGAKVDSGAFADSYVPTMPTSTPTSSGSSSPPSPPGPPTPGHPPCSGGESSGGAGQNSCSSGTKVQCGPDTYEIDCECPAATCTCIKNGTATTVMLVGCPTCPNDSTTLLSYCGL